MIDHSENLRPTGIDQSAKLGSGVLIFEPTNVYGCEIGNGVMIGPFCEIQNEVTVGPRTRIQSHSFICSLVDIGADCFIGHGVVFVNDKMSTGPARGDRSKWQKTKVGDRVSIGSNSTILPVSICDDVIIGAGAVVVKDILIPGTYAGNPAKRISRHK